MGNATCARSSADQNDQRSPLLVKLVHHLISLSILCPKAFTLHDIEQNCLQVFLQYRSNFLQKATAKDAVSAIVNSIPETHRTDHCL